MNQTRLPVTLLTGFLGAGKTTLLNAVLEDTSAGRTAVLVNEFGEAGLDHDLIASVRDDVVLMQSGCLCCTVRGELGQTMANLLARRDAGEISFERVVIETTGLADPGPILQTLRTDPFLARTTRMDGVVTVADAVNGPGTLNSQFESVSQAAMADVIILSKTDLAEPADVKAFEARLKSINPGARIVHAVKGQGAAANFFQQSGLRENAAPADVLSWTSGPTKAHDPMANISGLTTQPIALSSSMSPHDERITTASVVVDEPIDGDVFDKWLNNLVAMRGPNILRAKGIVFLKEIPKPFVFHGVQHVFNDPVPLHDWTGDSRQTRVVIIAKDISQRRLLRELNKLTQ